jgi:hypothetical protein
MRARWEYAMNANPTNFDIAELRTNDDVTIEHHTWRQRMLQDLELFLCEGLARDNRTRFGWKAEPRTTTTGRGLLSRSTL